MTSQDDENNKYGEYARSHLAKPFSLTLPISHFPPLSPPTSLLSLPYYDYIDLQKLWTPINSPQSSTATTTNLISI